MKKRMNKTLITAACLFPLVSPLTAQTTLHELHGTHAEEWFGYDVAALGDVDLDGIQDFVLTAPESFFAAARGPGAAHVHSGRDHSAAVLGFRRSSRRHVRHRGGPGR